MKITIRSGIPAGNPQLTVLIFLLIAGLIPGCTKEGPAGPPGPSGGGNDLLNPAIQPRVVSTLPADGSTGPYDLFAPGEDSYKPHVILQFNKLINTGDIQQQPPTITVQGFDRPVRVVLLQSYYLPKSFKPYVNGPFDNVLAFSIIDSITWGGAIYQIQKGYTLTVNPSLEDVNSNHLGVPYHFSFTPEPYFRSTSIYPPNQSTRVSRGSYTAIMFNSAINTGILPSLHISPPLPGQWRVSGDSLVASYFHIEPFNYNTTVTLSVDGNASDAAGHVIGSATVSAFTTVPFEVNDSYPQNGSTGIDLNRRWFSFYFTGDIDTASARAAFSVSPQMPGILSSYGNIVNYTPSLDLTPTTQYTITLSTALRAVEGNPLDADFKITFTTGRFGVSITYPEDGSNGIYRSTSCYVRFNGAIDTSSVRGAFHITPQIPVTLLIGDQGFDIQPMQQFAPFTVYTLTIDSTMRSRQGYTMGIPYSFGFRTGP